MMSHQTVKESPLRSVDFSSSSLLTNLGNPQPFGACEGGHFFQPQGLLPQLVPKAQLVHWLHRLVDNCVEAKVNRDVIFELGGVAAGVVADKPAVAAQGERVGLEVVAGRGPLGAGAEGLLWRTMALAIP